MKKFKVIFNGYSDNTYIFNDFARAYIFLIDKCLNYYIKQRYCPTISELEDHNIFKVVNNYGYIQTMQIVVVEETNDTRCFMEYIPLDEIQNKIKERESNNYILFSSQAVFDNNLMKTVGFDCVFIYKVK
jgi:hypothetical protein